MIACNFISLYHSYVVTFCIWSLYFVYGKNKETNKNEKNFLVPWVLSPSLQASKLWVQSPAFLGDLVYVTIGNPAFYFALDLTGVLSRDKLQHINHVGKQKFKCWPIRTWEKCQIVRRTLLGEPAFPALFKEDWHNFWTAAHALKKPPNFTMFEGDSVSIKSRQ